MKTDYFIYKIKQRMPILFKMLVLSVFIFISGISSKAQDAHFSQYYASPIILNPAQTGVLTGSNIRVASQYRSQWGSLTPTYTVMSLAGERKINKNYGIGAYLLNDDGVKAFNTFNFVISGSYVISSLSQNDMLLSVGLQSGIMYKYIKKKNLVFDSQYINGDFNVDLPSGEAFEKFSRVMPDVNLGINYESTKNEARFNPYSSFAIMHCTYPKESFLENGNSRLPLRFIFIGGTKIKYNNDLNFDPKLLLMKQSNNYEINIGLNTNYNFNSDVTLTGGVSYRMKDAAIVLLGCRYKNIIYRMSYDIVTSPLKTFTKGRGGFEFSIVVTDINRRSGSLL